MSDLSVYVITGEEAHLQSQDQFYAAGIWRHYAWNYLETSMSRQQLCDDIMNVPEPGLGNGRKNSRFGANNTFLFFTRMGEVVLARGSGAPCVREVASVTFKDLPGRWDVSVRANF